MPRPRNGRRIPRPSGFSGRTAWARSAQTPLRNFLRTETGGAAVLLAAAIAALIWVNIDESSYERLWETVLSIRLGDGGITLDLRDWVNSGLMTLFFLVVGLEARREFDIGELRERRRFALPLVAGLSGVAVSVAIYLAINAGRTSAAGWGVAMSTDTAFALGLLALVGPRFPDRLRAFMLTVVVVDDVVAVIVIATVYSETVHIVPLLVAVAILGAMVLARRFRVPAGVAFATLGTAAWIAMLKSGIEPVVVGLVLGLLTYAFPPPRSRLERVTERVREFREQPTAELARVAQVELRSATSANERLQQRFHPWTSYLVVPVFALANAGIAVNGSVLSSAFSSPITLGILFGYIVGKPVGIVGRLVAADGAEPPAPAAPGRLGCGRRGRDDRRRRLHGRPAGRNARLRRTRARGSQDRHPQLRCWRCHHHVAAVPRDGAAASAATDQKPTRDRRANRRSLHRRRP